MSSGSSSAVSRLVDQVFPRMPDFYGLINEQCDVSAHAMNAFVEFMVQGTKEKGDRVRALEKDADQLKARNTEILNKAFATPMDREDIYEAIVSVDEVVNYAKTTVRELEVLELQPDDYMVEIATLLRDGTQALQRGFAELAKVPAQAEAEAQSAHKAERKIEKVYRKALAELFDTNAALRALQSGGDHPEVTAMFHVIEMFKRREVYRHLSNAADRLARAGEVLHDIVVKIA